MWQPDLVIHVVVKDDVSGEIVESDETDKSSQYFD